MAITASQLRSNIYRLLDRVLESGKPLEIERRGEKLTIVPPRRPDKLGRLTPRADFLSCDPEELVHLDWSNEWRP
jgi:antitoxin (DNA-binding transcriptional repressor) of toxin-antitoxin stability system